MYLRLMKAATFMLLLQMMTLSVQAEEFTSGAKDLFAEFTACQTSIFEHIATSKENYALLGEFKQITDDGEWFDTKQIRRGSSEEIYRFDKPITIAGLAAVAAGYSFFKGDDAGYGGGDAIFWGFYFSESPEQVYRALGRYYPSVAAMAFLGDHYVNMKVLQRSGDKVFDQGSIIQSDTTQDGAKSYFSCSIQYKILNENKIEQQMTHEEGLLLSELMQLDASELTQLCFEDASKKPIEEWRKAAMACKALNMKHKR